MDQLSKQDIKKLLKEHQAQPIKRLGQNFLIDKTAIRKTIEAADIGQEDVLVEIGPGPGVLTREIAEKAKKVIVIEKDPKMVEILDKSLKGFKNIEIVKGDALKTELGSMYSYKVVGNLPFYLTAPIIRLFLEKENPPKDMTFIVQKEVGQRICAKPPKMSILAVSVQVYAKPKVISYISKGSFWPSPKVDSAIIRISDTGLNPKIDRELFFKIVKAGFSQPRKQLANNLSKGLGIAKEKAVQLLSRSKIEPSQRAETLKIEDWLSLLEDFYKNKGF